MRYEMGLSKVLFIFITFAVVLTVFMVVHLNSGADGEGTTELG